MRLLTFVRRNALCDFAGFGDWALKTGKKRLAHVWPLDMPPKARLQLGFSILSREVLMRFIFALRDRSPLFLRPSLEEAASKGIEAVSGTLLEAVKAKAFSGAEIECGHLVSSKYGPAVDAAVKLAVEKETKRQADLLLELVPHLNEANAGKFASTYEKDQQSLQRRTR